MNARELAAALGPGCRPPAWLLGARELELRVNHRDAWRRVEVWGVGFKESSVAELPRLAGAGAAIGRGLRERGAAVGVALEAGKVAQAWLETGGARPRRRSWTAVGSRECPVRDFAYRDGCLGLSGLDATLACVHRLHPLRRVRVMAGRVECHFVRPLPWPLLLRLDLARPLAQRAPEFCPRLGGTRVAAIALGDGTFEAALR